jgi:phosphate acetyltransferase
LSGLILTGETELDNRMVEFCRAAFATGLPLFRVTTDSYSTATKLYQMSPAVPIDDLARIRSAMDHVAQHIDIDWLISHSKTTLEFRMSPAAFLYQLTEKARAASKRIVLPEGAEPRTVKAAVICARRRIARCVLLGDREEIETVARSQDVVLPAELEILDPALIRLKYVRPLFELRKSKTFAGDGSKPTRRQRRVGDDDVGSRRGRLIGFRRYPLHRKHNSTGSTNHQDAAKCNGGVLDLLYVFAGASSGLRRLRRYSKSGR